MSSGPVCPCGNRERWRVDQRLHNRSAFNGYHFTPSDWSSVICLDHPARWRTKARYVEELADARLDPETGLWEGQAL